MASMEKEVVGGHKDQVAWMYEIAISDRGRRKFRYSILRNFHARLKKSIQQFARDISSTKLIALRETFPEFPPKALFGRSLDRTEAECRAKVPLRHLVVFLSCF